MLFSQLSQKLDIIEKTSSRTSMTQQLADLFKISTDTEARIISYIVLGHLRAPYESTQFGLAQKSIITLLARIANTQESVITEWMHASGDIGSVLVDYKESFFDNQNITHQNITVENVYDVLTSIEKISGTGSQEKKLEMLYGLLKSVDPLSGQLIVRIIIGTLRLGFSDMTIIDALSWLLVGDKSLRTKIEHAYNICADIGRIAQIVRRDGSRGLDTIHITIGVPIRPAAAERLKTPQEIIEKLGPCVAQPKLDGFRLQIHAIHQTNNQKDTQNIWFFSRNLVNMSAMFPDLVQAFNTYMFENIIVEGEALVYDAKKNSYVPFQETVKRKRKHDIEEAVSELPLHLFLFDILYYNGQSQLDKTHTERRALLLKIFTQKSIVSVIDEKAITTALELENYFNSMLKAGLEGLVVKRPDAAYQPGKRNFNWIKLKKTSMFVPKETQEKSSSDKLADTLDTVILGYYRGAGKRGQFGIGAFLIGVYNQELDRFETIAKVGTGLTDVEWRDLKERCDQRIAPEKPHNVVCAPELNPDVWVWPELVCQIRADEITRSPLHTAGKTKESLGFALRFPRFEGYRLDKSASDATTIEEVRQLFKNQAGR